jgi:hypothetical protein
MLAGPILGACATSAPLDRDGAFGVAKSAAAQFCSKGSGCDFRGHQKDGNWVVVADRYYVSKTQGKVFAVDDSLYFIIAPDGRILDQRMLP